MRPIVMLCALLAAGMATAAPPVAVKDFARKAEYESAKISPTGQFLAAAIPYQDQTMLGIIDLKTRKLTGALRFTGDEHVAGYWWVGPERVIATIATRGGPLDQPAWTGELYAMNIDGSHKQYLFGYRGAQQVGTHIKGVQKEYASASMVDPLVDDPLHALVAIFPWGVSAEGLGTPIERLNVHNGKRKRVAYVSGYSGVAVANDRAGRVRMAASMDQRSRFRLFAASSDGSSLAPVEHPGGAPENLDLYDASADGSSVYLVSNVPGGRVCLREYRFEGGFKDLECAESGAVGTPLFSLDDDKPIGLRLGDLPGQVRYFDSQHPDSRLLQSLEKAFSGQRVIVTSSTSDGKKVIVHVSSDRNPGDYYLVDRQTRKADYLLSNRSWIEPSLMAPVQPISYRTRDGVTIEGFLTSRAGQGAKKSPLVLMPHGGPHGVRDYWGWDYEAQLLASRGYSVLQVNFRGSGGYGPAHKEAGYRKWGTLMQDDLTDAVRWAIGQGLADPNRICIMGGSYGGYAALMSSTREPDLYRCAIGFAGVYDLVEQAQDSDIRDSVLGRNSLQKSLGDDEALMREQSPITHIAKLKIPVLIAHGTADRRVPFSQAKLLRKALEKHHKPYEWMEFMGEGHGLTNEENREAYLTKVVEFLDKHIGPAAAAP
ncbi:MAG: alpha/beta hydrolase family protein [Nevskiaceae bacterium]